MKGRRRKKPLGEQAEQLLDLPIGSLSAVPRIELTGDRQVLVENGCRLQVYEEDQICLSTACGTLRILGHRLGLSSLAADCIAVSGQILSVEFIE